MNEEYDAALMKAGHQIKNLQDQIKEMAELEEEVGRQSAVIRGLQLETARLDAVIERLGDEKTFTGNPNHWQKEMNTRIQYARDNRSNKGE